MTPASHPDRLLLAIAGALGAIGVATAAAASHRGGENLAIAANFMLVHAPALVGLSLMPRGRLIRLAAYLLALGLVLFAGDLATRELQARALFPLAAPLGGFGLIGGWLLVTVAAIIGWKKPG
ncbi:Uncharacterized membrane protein YgdD, TMEM256/DUF423 family [Devosia enhydra]|uniref:Uncharacterized membrane protein YgdD, TMEM256/DUF423 family n=1 Tax=Devosia enhydra TaxID=665118 RepID=A0A1K2HVV1_9HYPH|nr:DUF423 domain-containing protein [Devosia enhydra]SFZ82929.1 Uncharacterized membrane protein YgdD, TMEM256/DUF423 family [Devosia enhydra]